MSMAVQAMASAPSMAARSAGSVTHRAVKSGWWFTAGMESMPSAGWIDGMASETFPMSVEAAARFTTSPRSGNVRPMASAFRRYSRAMSGSWRISV